MNNHSLENVVTDDIGLLSFGQLDRQRGFVPELDTSNSENQPASWEQWFDSIYEMAFQDLTDEDFSRITNNGWYPEYFVPLSLSRLEVNAFIGYYHDGQVLENIGTVYEGFLHDNPHLLNEYCHILNRALHLLYTDGERIADPDCVTLQDGTTVFHDTHARLLDMQAALSCC